MTISDMIEALEELREQCGGEATVFIEADHVFFEPRIIGEGFDRENKCPVCIIETE